MGFHRSDERFVVGAHGSAPADLSFHSMLMRVAARATPTRCRPCRVSMPKTYLMRQPLLWLFSSHDRMAGGWQIGLF